MTPDQQAQEDRTIVERVARGEMLGAADALGPRYREALVRLMSVFVDSALCGAAGFVNVINSAPGLRERSIGAGIVSEKFAHAEAVLKLLAPFGIDARDYVRAHPWNARLLRDVDLGTERLPGDKRLNVFHYPFEGWTDAVAMNMLMGRATALQLAELKQCSYQPLARVMSTIVDREARHARLGETGLAQAIARSGGPQAAQLSIAYWYPRVADTFGRSDSERAEEYRAFGLRQSDNESLLQGWQDDVAPRLTALGLQAPRV